VTRMKKGCKFKVRQCAKKAVCEGIKADQKIRLCERSTKKKYPQLLRRISYLDAKTGRRYVFITNRFDLTAKMICDIYKSRWEVELFFKTLKGNLQINKFVGSSVNAVLWQVWTAMIGYLLVSSIRFLNKLKWSVSSVMAVLAVCLFQKTDFDTIFDPLPRERLMNREPTAQLTLNF